MHLPDSVRRHHRPVGRRSGRPDPDRELEMADRHRASEDDPDNPDDLGRDGRCAGPGPRTRPPAATASVSDWVRPDQREPGILQVELRPEPRGIRTAEGFLKARSRASGSTVSARRSTSGPCPRDAPVDLTRNVLPGGGPSAGRGRRSRPCRRRARGPASDRVGASGASMSARAPRRPRVRWRGPRVAARAAQSASGWTPAARVLA